MIGFVLIRRVLSPDVIPCFMLRDRHARFIQPAHCLSARMPGLSPGQALPGRRPPNHPAAPPAAPAPPEAMPLIRGQGHRRQPCQQKNPPLPGVPCRRRVCRRYGRTETGGELHLATHSAFLELEDVPPTPQPRPTT
jgi:hypothetical protein